MAVTITVVDTITSFTSGIIIFGILGNLAYETNTEDISTVVQGGTGLAFVSYPDAIAKFDWIPQLFSSFFFVMLFIIGVGCVAGLQICLMTAVQDWFGRQNKLKLVVGLATVQFLIGLIYVTPVRIHLNKVSRVSFIYIVSLCDIYSSGWSIPCKLGRLLLCIVPDLRYGSCTTNHIRMDLRYSTYLP